MKKNKNISGFKTPENYFEDFEAQLFSKIDEVNLPKSPGFNVPQNYFENLEEQVLKAVKNSEKPTKVVSLFPKKYFGYAAAIAACLIIGFTVFNNKSDNETLNALQLALIDNYIEEGNLNLDLYDVTTLINDEDIANLDLEVQQFSEVSLKNYILEYMDEETIIDEQ
jgi:hypothetical protein